MDDLFLPRPPHHPQDPEGTVHLDPLVSRRLETRPWEVRSAQWRAWSLAEMAFGAGVRTELKGRGRDGVFRGLLEISVPFHDMASHLRRERTFLSWAHSDPVLSRVHFLFVFQPEPVEVVQGLP